MTMETTNKKSGKILVVDDEPDIVRAVSMRLSAQGYRVVSADSGANALATAVSELPDLIILDIGLPDGDGHAVAQELLRHQETRFTPIIYLTARKDMSDYREAVRLGASQYITKPFKSEDLLTAVEMLLTGHRRYC